VNRQALIDELHREAKALAVRYYQVTGKPLGITGEMAELEAAKLLGLELAEARTPYYDATRSNEEGVQRIQIKGRAVDPANRYRGRVSAIKCNGDFELVVLVLLDRLTFDVIEIWEASRATVAARLSAPGSLARNERNSLAIAQFKSIARKVWPVANFEGDLVRTDYGNSSPQVSSAAIQSKPAKGIGSYIAELLAHPEFNYEQIAFRVRQRFPGAQTSVKSVASTARDLRRRGVAVPTRLR
jgi:hypothetical protein